MTEEQRAGFGVMWEQCLWNEYLQRLEPSLVQELKVCSFENLLVLGLLIHEYQSFILHKSIYFIYIYICVCVWTLEN